MLKIEKFVFFILFMTTWQEIVDPETQEEKVDQNTKINIESSMKDGIYENPLTEKNLEEN